ncbi:MAG: GNAT family N-acetyltransferase [Thermodesulfobacteriota bacterium]|nr:GNAT family N-acetyltransferase [Thermodesulfobacteriota bacterium]
MITLRRATEEDCEIIFQWRNHPKVRHYFFDSSELSYSEHKKWFEESLKRDDRIILIAHNDSTPLGVLRFDSIETDENIAEIDIYVAPELQGQGFGKMILSEGENWAIKNTRIKSLLARVREENQASVKMFRHCGFMPAYILLKKEIAER